jgi:hypothetical protein
MGEVIQFNQAVRPTIIDGIDWTPVYEATKRLVDNINKLDDSGQFPVFVSAGFVMRTCAEIIYATVEEAEAEEIIDLAVYEGMVNGKD